MAGIEDDGARPKTCQRPGCPDPAGRHKVRYVCPDGVVYDPATGAIDTAIKARGGTHIPPEWKAVLDAEIAKGTSFKNMPDPNKHGCVNAKLIREADGSIYTIPADAAGVGFSLMDLATGLFRRAFGALGRGALRPSGLAIVVLLAAVSYMIFASSPGDGVIELPAAEPEAGRPAEPASRTPEPTAARATVFVGDHSEAAAGYRRVLAELEWAWRLDERQAAEIRRLDELGGD